MYYIIAASLKACYFPSVWKRALVLAFPKPGKDPASPNYRPISLLSILSKIYEGIIYSQIELHVNTNNVIINEQFGFKPQHSTVLQLLRVSEYFELEINKNRNSAMILLDIKRAFDSVWHKGLLYKLHLQQLPVYLIKIVRDYLSDRSFAVSFQGELSSYLTVAAGIPQGSRLGPLLFNAFANDIPRTTTTQLAVYADDTAVFTSSWSPTLLSHRLQSHVDTIIQYFSDWKMAINADKTEAICFTRKH
ncbi:PREDICTED: RNA-directed DNA polymerase from mobile element jockey-like [Wasmannia auropunctata]|uniref:RNA-directed DNA polymerase from mobile element jockey-like n=1 Tax=Wasmannia auropunctata TaxID=64793 RepID=UPI0005EFDAB0|nr:PREDICTED: RNA-directed DNA polymerase from mobile element jockey-like [Wasmannia auropunctata]